MIFSLGFAIGLAILTTYRIARLIAFDDIFSGLRGRCEFFASQQTELKLLNWIDSRKNRQSKKYRWILSGYYFVSSNLNYLINCTFCLGVWIGVLCGLLIAFKYEIRDPFEIALICFAIPGGQSLFDDFITGLRRI